MCRMKMSSRTLYCKIFMKNCIKVTQVTNYIDNSEEVLSLVKYEEGRGRVCDYMFGM